jgi:hypothetical protein
MCDPATATLVVAAVGAVTSIATSVVSADAQRKSAHTQRDAQIDAAKTAANADYLRLSEQASQVNDQNKLERLTRMRAGLRERAIARVGSGESGLMGSTPGREGMLSYLNQQFDMSVLEQNRVNAQGQIEANRQAVGAQEAGRINVANSIQGPSSLASGLQIGSAVLGGAGNMLTAYGNNTPKPNYSEDYLNGNINYPRLKIGA